MPQNTSFDPNYQPTLLNDDDEPKLDLSQLQNESLTDLAHHIVDEVESEQQADSLYPSEHGFDIGDQFEEYSDNSESENEDEPCHDPDTYQEGIVEPYTAAADEAESAEPNASDNDEAVDLNKSFDHSKEIIDTYDIDDELEGALDLTSLDGSADKDAVNAHTSYEGVDPEALYNDTMELMKSGKMELETGVKLLRRSAKKGYTPALLYLGQMFSNKNYALYNPALAFDCFAEAAELGCADGYYNQGLCYSTGFGCQKDTDAAMQSFSRGAELFDPNCICAVAMCYEFGSGCEINYEYAFNLYEKGAELGHAGCTNNLGGCYFYGHGIEQDKQYAIELFKQASELGSTNAKCRLGLCYMNGDGCEQDYALAFDYLKNAAAEQNATALFNLAKCYDGGIGTEQNFRAAYKCYSRAAKLGHAEAKYEAGKMSMQGRGTKKDATAAYRMFSSAVRHGYAPAEYEVANCFFEGTGAVRNRTNAYSHFFSAYRSGGENQANAAYKLGLCHLKGLGVKQDKQKAAEWFSVAHELESPEASYMLGECYYYGVGVEKDADRAFTLYTLAAQKALQCSTPLICHAHLFIAIAQCCEKGIGTQQDAGRAISAYKEAAQYSDPEALYRTGKAIFGGVGMKAELPAARIYFLRAARHGYMPATLMMGIFSENGKSAIKNSADAKGWYVKSVTSKTDPQISLYEFPERFAENISIYTEAKTEAQYRLGMIIAREAASAQDQIRAFEHIALSAAMGYTPARKEITKIHLSGGDLRTYYESPFSLEDATFENGQTSPSAKDLAIAMYKLGDAFYDGKGLLKKNDVASINCYKVSAELGMVDACYSYGWCLRHGVGAEVNDVEAVKWLKLAADRGNSGAAYSYGLCCEEGAGTGVKNKREAMYYYRIAAASGNNDAAKRYIELSNYGD